ncbi:AraC family transcriptional regulator [Vibrio salinus]|uniref:AraC family transcriptional regulator n=1 Tax=Vibrio salinus TaxID=2899784 RepID=UPI001E645F17|nr:AraC family transcriptional regulator [Vibrio salinus]MCE0495196.1 AraC family transcriptional regulator [Vibrio salinus]
MEAFSSLIQQFQFHTEVYHNARLCGNWKLEQHRTDQTCFHLITGGHCYLSIPDYGDTVLEYGDLILFPKEPQHSLFNTELQTSQEGTQDTDLLCAKVDFGHSGVEALLKSLPHVLILKNQETNFWLKPILNLIIAENTLRHRGSDAILNRLSELIFIYSLRHYLNQNPTEVSLLALYADTRLSLAVDAIHTHPGTNWTIDKLAQISAMSRTRFAVYFKSRSGWTVMQYITWWRMQVALGLLKQGESVSTVSYQVGYQSESAFSRVFAKHFGCNPGKASRQFRSGTKSDI